MLIEELTFPGLKAASSASQILRPLAPQTLTPWNHLFHRIHAFIDVALLAQGLRLLLREITELRGCVG